jgi:hypothetical protein
MRGRWIALAAAAALLVAAAGSCGGDDGTSSDATGPASTPPATIVPTASTNVQTTAMTSGESPTSTPGATTVPSTTATNCPPTGSVDPKEENFPELMSLLGSDVRTGLHPCFERIVIELEGDGPLPGWWVRYAEGPVSLGQTDDQFVELRGDADLLITVSSWMTDMEGNGYQGDRQILPEGLTAIEELYLIDNFEGMHTWAVGLDQERPFSVFTLTEPPRIVIDVSTA